MAGGAVAPPALPLSSGVLGFWRKWRHNYQNEGVRKKEMKTELMTLELVILRLAITAT